MVPGATSKITRVRHRAKAPGSSAYHRHFRADRPEASGPDRCRAINAEAGPGLPPAPPAETATVTKSRRPARLTNGCSRVTMLLCLSRGSDDISVAAVLGLRSGCSDRVIAGLRTRQGWAAPGGAQALIRSRPAGQVRPGTADESFEGQQVRGSRISGQAVPGAFGC